MTNKQCLRDAVVPYFETGPYSGLYSYPQELVRKRAESHRYNTDRALLMPYGTAHTPGTALNASKVMGTTWCNVYIHGHLHMELGWTRKEWFQQTPDEFFEGLHDPMTYRANIEPFIVCMLRTINSTVSPLAYTERQDPSPHDGESWSAPISML